MHLFACSLGEIRDLSALGAYVACKGRGGPKPGDTLPFTVTGLDGDIQLTAKIAWRKRTGWFRYELGVEFLKPDAAAKAALGALARTAPMNEVFQRAEWLRKSA